MNDKSASRQKAVSQSSVRQTPRRNPAIPHVDAAAYLKRLERRKQGYQRKYYAMYTSVAHAIVTDPRLMTVPFDDHMVHRGDGVFEVFLCRDGALYNLDAHLDRLEISARALQLPLPMDRDTLVYYIMQTVQTGGQPDCTVRVNLSRGPGGFSVNPFEAVAPQVYIVAYQPTPPFMLKQPAGATAAIYSKPLRHFTRPVIKSCNYLFNVMMKLEADARGVDFTIARDENGYFAEGATASLAFVTRHGDLLFPRPRHILRGTTAARAKTLARALVRQRVLRGVWQADLSLATLRSATELLLFGTTITVAPVTELNRRRIGNGKPGPIASALFKALERDIDSNPALRLPVWKSRHSTRDTRHHGDSS